MSDNAEQNNTNNRMVHGITDASNVGNSAVVQQQKLLSAGVLKTDVTNSSKTLTVLTAANNNQVPQHLTQSDLNTPNSTLTKTYTTKEYLNDVITKCKMTLQKIFEEDIIKVSESVKDEQIEFSKALVLSPDRNFFSILHLITITLIMFLAHLLKQTIVVITGTRCMPSVLKVKRSVPCGIRRWRNTHSTQTSKS